MNLKLLIASFLFIGLFSCSTHDESGDNIKPNIILIMADDLGMETIGAYGGESYQTPVLDKLASQGLMFTRAYSTPLCTPTRVQIMTGKYNFRNYVGFGILDSDEKTFGHYLQNEGYRTGIAGKWQLWGNKRQFELAGQHGSLPQQAGFDEYCLWQVQDRGYRYKKASVEYHDSTFAEYDQYGPDLFTEFALNFIEKNKKNPFFLYYPMVLVHDPFQPSPSSESYDSLSRLGYNTNDTTYFRNMINYMDGIVGKIVEKVEKEGLSENTIIIFTGDNGTDRKVISKWKGKKVKGRKGHTVDAGIHVPMFVWWKGVVKPKVIDHLVDFTDILPTFLEASGKDPSTMAGLDGNSLFPLIRGDEDFNARDYIFCSYAPKWGRFEDSEFIMDKDYKVYSDGGIFKYMEDPEEKNDLSNRPEISGMSRIVTLKISLDSILNSN